MFRVLRDELKRRKSNGETNLVIRNDKIVVKSKPLNNNSGTLRTPALPTQIQAMDQTPQITLTTPSSSNNHS